MICYSPPLNTPLFWSSSPPVIAQAQPLFIQTMGCFTGNQKNQTKQRSDWDTFNVSKQHWDPLCGSVQGEFNLAKDVVLNYVHSCGWAKPIRTEKFLGMFTTLSLEFFLFSFLFYFCSVLSQLLMSAYLTLPLDSLSVHYHSFWVYLSNSHFSSNVLFKYLSLPHSPTPSFFP